MIIKIILGKREFEVRHDMTVQKVLHKLDIQRISLLATLDGELITDDEIIKEDTIIKLIPVLSGG